MVWINAGHEIFQEARAQTTTLLEQAIVGYHECNDVVYAMNHPEFISAAGGSGKAVSSVGETRDSLNETSVLRSRRGAAGAGRSSRENGSCKAGGGGGGRGAFEDGYIDSVLSTMGDMQSEARHRERGKLLRSFGGSGDGGSCNIVDGNGRGTGKGEENKEDRNDDNTEMGSAWDGSVGEVYGSSWENYRASVVAAGANSAARGGHFGNDVGGSASDEEEQWRRDGGAGANYRRKGGRRLGGGDDGRGPGGGGAQGRSIMVGTVLDASHPAFERQDNLVYGYGQGSKVYPQPEEFPEVSARGDRVRFLTACLLPVRLGINRLTLAHSKGSNRFHNPASAFRC